MKNTVRAWFYLSKSAVVCSTEVHNKLGLDWKRSGKGNFIAYKTTEGKYSQFCGRILYLIEQDQTLELLAELTRHSTLVEILDELADEFIQVTHEDLNLTRKRAALTPKENSCAHCRNDICDCRICREKALICGDACGYDENTECKLLFPMKPISEEERQAAIETMLAIEQEEAHLIKKSLLVKPWCA